MPIGLNHETKNINAHQEIVLQVGSIFCNGRSTAPTGYLLCDGSAISRVTYADLFTAISTTYGVGDGSTTFNLPDLRGVVPRGAGISNGYTQNVTVTLGAKDNDTFQGHKIQLNNVVAGTDSTYRSNPILYNTGGSSSDTSLISDGSNGTPRTGNETKMKNLGVNFFIKF